jgi:methanogenic corrinoid protein MtbC1
LHQLTEAAQARNSREAITGLMLYDQGCFFQWLEGPRDSLDRVMGSIRNDSRHTDIEIIRCQAARHRAFGSWTMKLAAQVATAIPSLHDVIEPPKGIIESLRRNPETAPSLLTRLVGVSFNDTFPELTAPAPIKRSTAAILKDVMLATVIPALAKRHGVSSEQSGTWPVSNRTSELVELLIGSNDAAAIDLIKEMRITDGLLKPLYATLFEPAARKLGDLWTEDVCSEFDVTVGLARMQMALRLLTATAPEPSWASHRPVVLIAPEPGELHQLGAVLASDVLRSAGWSTHCEYPTDEKALQDLLSVTWFDALDLSLSAAFRRDHRLPGLTTTIANVRRASLNPAMVVVVGGRVFVEEATAGALIGADIASRTAVDLDRSITDNLNAVRATAGYRLN